ncbi:histidine kinase [Kribbella flavida DSM 17836]|uniref:histidine kinase n=1 Tax=Kribbella flavida (strain DSM 17836 / JCM 10339 / NBRC 14399) TaxID=479435 RepID=D2PKG6_KRIFD|nr:HAMP domain-containing sensor histidine kinase [Kribbella flavida]ADB30478.1 histidine kinase [Kribbella flavida DSM 17836]
MNGPILRRLNGATSRLPSWAQTIRFRLTLAYSAVLIALSALLLGGVYAALTAYLDPKPLDPITVKKVTYGHDGEIKVKPGYVIQAAEISSIQSAVHYQTLQTLRNYSAAGMGVLFLVSLGTGWWLSGRALRPVRAITATAQDISATDLSRRIAMTGPRDELRTLADTVDDMLARLETAFVAQRQLVDDASHELRNPLAVIQANVDAVLAHDDTPPEDRAQATAIVARAIQRMTRLVEDLLASARRSSPAFVDADVDLAAIAGEAAEEYGLIAADREIRLVRRLAPGPIAAGDASALRRAVDNLLSNAVRLARGGSELVLAVGSRNGWAWIAVRDDGPGIAAEDADRVFDRFFRSGQRQSPATVPSTGERRAGLGLAIVRQIVESHGGSVALHSEVGVGSTFVLWLPERSLTNDTRRTPAPPEDDPLGPRP